MPHVLPVLASLLLCAATGAQGLAFRQVVPAAAAGVEGASTTALPFGSTLARHVMYAYDGSAVGYGAPVRIAALSLRCDGATAGSSANGSYDFTLDLSTSRHAPAALALAFAQNHGHDRLRVHAGALAVPAPAIGGAPNAFSLRIPLSVPFDWDPRSGPLLLDFGYSASTPAFAGWDAVSGAVGGIAAIGSTALTASSVLTIAPVLQLELQGDVAPSALAANEAVASTSYPWALGAGQQMRTLYLYTGSSMGFTGRRRITSLAWRTDLGLTFPGRTFTVRISLSTSGLTPTTLVNTFADNHGPDRTVVFDGVLTAPATAASSDLGDFDLFCELQRPFEYDPAEGALAVEMQLFDSTGSGPNFDCLSGSSVVGRAWVSQSATAATAANVQPGVGLVMALRTVPVPTVPASLANTVNGSGGNGTGFPFGSSNCRTMLLVSAAEAGITEPFVVRHLRFRPTQTELVGGPSTWTMTVDLSHAVTTPASMNTTFDANHGADRERVLDGQVSLPYFVRAGDDRHFPIELKLDRPFLWSPSTSNYLAIDVRITGRTGDAVLCETTFGLTHDDARLTAGNAGATTGSLQSIAPVVQLGGDRPNALATNYGSGCPGTNGVPITGTIGLPSLPNPDLQVTIRSALGNAAAVFFAGFASVTVTLPGTVGCDLLHAAEVGMLGWTITDPAGYGAVPLPLANDISMEGLVFRTQWLVLDPTANALGLVTSDAQQLVAKFF